MYRSLVALLLLLLSVAGRAQDAGMKIKFHKDRPVHMLAYERLYDPNNTSVSKRKLRKSGRFTDAEVEEIFRRLADDALLPPGMDRLRAYASDQSLGARYRMYEQSSFSLLGYDFSLVWIPQDENMHMPANLRPPTSEGSIWYTYGKHLAKGRGDAALAKSSQQTGGGRDIQVSSADMSQFTQNASQGTMILYYGDGGAASQAYVYELRGPGLSDKKGVADELAAKISAAEAFIGFEHRPGADCPTTEGYIKKKAGSSISVRCAGMHNVR